jgi:hypothetical protein
VRAKTAVAIAILVTVLSMSAVPVYAQDLELADVTTLRIGACDTQVRFQIKLSEATPAALKYRVGVYSTTRNKLLMTFPVPSHSLGEILHFAVPGSTLICDNQIEIRVDDQNQVNEANKRNNSATVKIDRPHTGSMIDPCAVPLEKCQ